MRRVEKWSLGYEALRTVARTIYRCTYRNLTVNGRANVPKNKPIIFSPNHQNALDDPLAILLTSFYQVVFLARADIFKNKIVARILHFMKISPVYRLRDGKESLDKNKEVFDNSVRVLTNNKMLCLFPEAQHIGMKSMLPHKKAISRIVFMAAQQTNFDLDIQIAPVGINYSHYFNFRRSLTINYGAPISSKKYYQTFIDEGETKASAALRDDIYDALLNLVVHVPDKDMYELYEQGFEIALPQACKKLGFKNYRKYFYEGEKLITEKLSTWIPENKQNADELLNTAKKYKRLKNKLSITENDLKKGAVKFSDFFTTAMPAFLLLLVGLLGAIAHGWLFYLTRYPYRKKIKDKQFYSSFSMVLSLVVYPIWLIILYFIVSAITGSWIIALAVIVLSVPSGIVAWESLQMFSHLKNRFRLSKLLKGNNTNAVELLNKRNQLELFFKNLIQIRTAHEPQPTSRRSS